MRVKSIETGNTFELRVQPIMWGLVLPENGAAFSTMPSRSPSDHRIEIVQASKRERELLERHGLLQEKPTLLLEVGGEHVPGFLEIGPALCWDRLGCLNADEAEDHRGLVVSASANDVAVLRRFGFGDLLERGKVEELAEQIEEKKIAA